MSEPGPPAVIELRIHGVSGTELTALLEDSTARPYDADGYTAFARQHVRPEHQVDPAHPYPDVTIDGYRWGALTSGQGPRSLWLLLLPFALVNAAVWTLGGRRDDHRDRLGPKGPWSVIVRIVGLFLTIEFTFASCVVGIDLIGRQLGVDPSGEKGGWVRPINVAVRFISDTFLPDTAHAGQRLAIAATGPLVFLALLTLLSNSITKRYADYHPGKRPESRGPSDSVGLANPGFWHDSERDGSLRRAHSAVIMSVVALFLIRMVWGARPAGWFWVLIAVVTACGLVGALTLVWPAGRIGLAKGAQYGAALGLVATWLVVLCECGLGETLQLRGGRSWWAGFERPTRAAVLIIVIVGLALVPATVREATTKGPDVPRHYRWASMIACAAAVAWSFVLSAGIDVLVVNSVDSDVVLTAAVARMGHAIIGFVAALLLAGGGVLVVMSARRRATGLSSGKVAGALANHRLLEVVIPAVGTVGLALAASVLVDLIGLDLVSRLDLLFPDRVPHLSPSILGMVAVAIVVVAAIAWKIAARWLDTPPPWLRVAAVVVVIAGAAWSTTTSLSIAAGRTDEVTVERGSDRCSDELAVELTLNGEVTGCTNTAAVNGGATLGYTLLIGVIALQFLLARAAWRSEALRRRVGIAWDLFSFFPRAGHPFAPPAYGERVVPQLVLWIAQRSKDGPIVVSGHSQGSLIAGAAVVALHHDEAGDAPLGRAGLLTYGSLLRRMYPRLFPLWWGSDELATMHHAMGSSPLSPPRWRHLRRLTDPLAGRIGYDDIDVVASHDPATVPGPRAVTRQPILAHSDYPKSPEYRAALQQVHDVLRPRTES